MSASEAGAPNGDRWQSDDGELDTHALAIVSFLYNRVISGPAPALRKHVGLSVTEARLVFHLGATALTTANKLAKELGLDKAAVSRSIARLIELGLITSDRDPDRITPHATCLH